MGALLLQIFCCRWFYEFGSSLVKSAFSHWVIFPSSDYIVRSWIYLLVFDFCRLLWEWQFFHSYFFFLVSCASWVPEWKHVVGIVLSKGFGLVVGLGVISACHWSVVKGQNVFWKKTEVECSLIIKYVHFVVFMSYKFAFFKPPKE